MRTRFLILGLCVGLLSGCSYSRQWRAALEHPIPADSIAGPWEGQWISDVNGHNGRLRCIMTPRDDGAYDAHFHAKYRKIFGFAYSVPLRARRTGENEWEFDGEADLGRLAGGAYTYHGAATPENFFSTYHSKYDHGKFEMTRPVQEE